MKKIKNVSLLVLIVSLFAVMILNYANIELTNTNVVSANKYNDGNEQNNLNYYVEEQYFPNIQNEFDTTEITNGAGVVLSAGPFTYQDLDYFSGKTLTKIGIPVKSVKAVDENQTFTLYVVDKTPLKSNQKTTASKTYELKLPKDQLGSSTTVNKWIYVDLSKYNITLSENETLAFCASTDTVNWGYAATNSSSYIGEKYEFSTYVLTNPRDPGKQNIFFDIYVAKEETVTPSSNLLNKAKDLNISILGDSISTYTGYSNDSTNTNSTIGGNSIFYKGTNEVTNVNDTWWMQAVNVTGMNLLVNNSYSGSTVANSHSSRALQLHDDTGTNAGTNPDIIAVYLGINDIKNGTNVENFKTNYTKMIQNIRNKYTTSKIFVFTHVPYYYPSAAVPTLDATGLEAFNDVIRDIAEATEECYVVDLYANSGITHDNISYYMFDAGLHPSIEGMDMITKAFLQTLETVDFEKEVIEDTTEDTTEDDTENEEEVENPFTSTSLIKIISLVIIVGSIILLVTTFKNTKVNKYE